MAWIVRGNKCLALRLLALLAVLTLMPACASFYEYIGFDTQQSWPDSAQQSFERALSHQYSGRLEDAAKQLELAVKADPNMYHAWYMLGYVYRAMDKPDLARKAWETGLQRALIGPDREDYPRGRSLAQIRTGLASLDLEAPPKKVRAKKPGPPPGKQLKPRARPKAKAKAKYSPGPKGRYAVLYSSNLKPVNAARDKKRLAALGYPATVKAIKMRGKTWHRVWVGCCSTKGAAQKLAIALRKKGIGKGMVVMVFK